MIEPTQYFLSDDGIFPNSYLPALHYKSRISIPLLLAAVKIQRIFKRHGWTNNWRDGIYTYAHYHSNTHEAMVIVKGKTDVQLGGNTGPIISISAGDLLIIPAGVAHKNLGNQNHIVCVGGYPEGRKFDIKLGAIGERPAADSTIASVPLPSNGPIGPEDKLATIWQNVHERRM